MILKCVICEPIMCKDGNFAVHENFEESYCQQIPRYDCDLVRQNKCLMDNNMLLKEQLQHAEDVTNGLVQTIEKLEQKNAQ